MPDDLLTGFEFITDKAGRTMLGDPADRETTDRIVEDVIIFRPAARSGQNERNEMSEDKTTDWIDNVPPDMTDEFDLLL